MMETKGQGRVEGRQQIRWWKLKDRGDQKVGRQQIRWWKLKTEESRRQTTDQMVETKGQRRVEGRQQIRWWKLKDRGEQKVDNRSDGGN